MNIVVYTNGAYAYDVANRFLDDIVESLKSKGHNVIEIDGKGGRKCIAKNSRGIF